MSKVKLIAFDKSTNTDDNAGLRIGDFYEVVALGDKGEITIDTDLGNLILFHGEYEYV